MDGGVRPAAEPVTVNKKELARLLDVSLPTLDKMIEDNPDFPIESRGSNGREYGFDPEKVRAWRAAKREQIIQEQASRQSALGSLGFGDDAAALQGLTPHEQLAMARVEKERRNLAREAGMLMDVATLRACMAPVFTDLVSFLDGLPDAIGRKHNLAPGMVDDLRADVETARDRFAADLEKALAAPHGKDNVRVASSH